MTQRTQVAVAALALAAVLSAAEPAQAGIGACGNIHVEAEAMCEVVPPGIECEGMCTPISVRAACAAQLTVECDAGCDELPSVDCRGECTAGCMASCTDLEPGEFDCQASCQADCSGNCEAHCEADANSAECEASCEASCSASCEGHCDVELPSADCEAGCDASCEGSCDVDANLDCQVDCQSEGFAECEAEIEGGCDIACEGEEGALFCDGNYVDHGDNLDMCIDALRAAVDIEVMAHAESSASCGDGEGCMASAKASVSSNCAAVPGRAAGGGVALGMLGLLGLTLSTRRRRR